MGGFSGVSGAAPFGGAAGFAGAFAGAAGFAGAGGVNTDPQCMGIKSNMACPIEGKLCPNLPCGLGDAGRRGCSCATFWTCTACDFSSSFLATRPPNIQPCSQSVQDGFACTVPASPSTVCSSIVATNEYCVCASIPRQPALQPEWDCDAAPSSW
jgi:hypothetical protein